MKRIRVEKPQKKKESPLPVAVFTSPYVYKECHKGTIFVASSGRLSIYAGGTLRDVSLVDMDIVIPLIGDSFSLQNLFMNLEGENLFGELKEFSLLQNKAVMSIDWRDQGVPKLKKEFWETFVGILKKESEKRPINVLFFCVGGHGRTGTALSIVCHLLEFSTGDPIEWVRKNYCKEAVESYAQVSYIEEILGIKSFAQVAPTFNWKGNVFNF